MTVKAAIASGREGVTTVNVVDWWIGGHHDQMLLSRDVNSHVRDQSQVNPDKISNSIQPMKASIIQILLQLSSFPP